LAIEPLTGKRIALIYDKRRKIEYAEFMQIVASHYPDTHNASSFYERFDAPTAYELTQKFEFHYTPKKGSWLNTAEIEFSAIARGCLNRRIATKKELEQEVLAFIKEREEKQIKINWTFDITAARQKMKRHYEKVNSANKSAIKEC